MSINERGIRSLWFTAVLLLTVGCVTAYMVNNPPVQAQAQYEPTVIYLVITPVSPLPTLVGL